MGVKAAKKAPVFAPTPRPARIQLQKRDVRVLHALAVHRFLSGEQLRRLVYHPRSASLVRRRLRQLYDHRLIDRVPVALQATRGMPSLVYSLTRLGASILAQFRPSRVVRSTRVRFTRHRHLVNELHIGLVEGARAANCTIRDWHDEEDLKVHSASRMGRPESVSVNYPNRPARKLPFLPDGYFQRHDGQGNSFAFFVEVDLATHSLRVWRDRAWLYVTYDREGLFRARFGRETFRLLILTTRDYRKRSRRNNILDAIRDEVGPCDMFLATTLAELGSQRLFDPVWRWPGGRHPCRIMPTSNGQHSAKFQSCQQREGEAACSP